MKKAYLFLLSLILVTNIVSSVAARTMATNSVTASAIRLYKAGNYTKSYVEFSNILNKDPSNALAYYYLGMTSVQLGKKEEALSNYNKAVELSPNGVLGSYAKQGIKCVEEPVACRDTDDSELTPEDKFIKSPFGSGFSHKARGVHEKEKIENIKREINHEVNKNEDNKEEEMKLQKQFKEYRDFSSQAPTNDEIVNAIRTLKAAGLGDIMSLDRYSTNKKSMYNATNNIDKDDYGMLDIMFGNEKAINSGFNPQLIQALMTNQMTANF